VPFVGLACDCSRVRSISHLGYTGLFGAVGATIDKAIAFDAVANDLAAAMFARRGQNVDGTLETVKDVTLAQHYHFKGFVILISAGFTTCH
jgi:hypothetical protein